MVKSDEAAVLIDAGISAKRIMKELERTDTPPEKVKALFLTHEHYDHITGVRVLLKRLKDANAYASPGTFGGTKEEVSDSRRIAIIPDENIRIDDMTIRAFRTLHDAEEPYGYIISSDSKKVALVTDTGAMTEEMLENIADADILVLEANHDTELLRRGSYPLYLKRRILSDYGHLSNSQAAAALLRLFGYADKKRVVLLGHLSGENNTPAIAEMTVLTALAREGRYTGSDLYLGVLLRNEASLIYRL